MSRVTLDPMPGRESHGSWGRKHEEYVADFCLVSKRVLTALEYRIFKYHVLLGADWKLCCRQLKMDRGTFFHAVYRIQQKLGRRFRELEPYSLYPTNEYFYGAPKNVTSCLTPKRKIVPIRPPVKGRPSPLPREKSA